MIDVIIIGSLGFVGALTRHFMYVLERRLSSHIFPYGTLVINLLGCLVAGVVFTLAEKMAPEQKHFLMLASIGFIGSFTTFSAFSMDTFHLMQNDLALQAVLNVLLNVVLGLGMVWLGRTITE